MVQEKEKVTQVQAVVQWMIFVAFVVKEIHYLLTLGDLDVQGVAKAFTQTYWGVREPSLGYKALTLAMVFQWNVLFQQLKIQQSHVNGVKKIRVNVAQVNVILDLI